MQDPETSPPSPIEQESDHPAVCRVCGANVVASVVEVQESSLAPTQVEPLPGNELDLRPAREVAPEMLQNHRTLTPKQRTMLDQLLQGVTDPSERRRIETRFVRRMARKNLYTMSRAGSDSGRVARKLTRSEKQMKKLFKERYNRSITTYETGKFPPPSLK